jgi:hypothetical protein
MKLNKGDTFKIKTNNGIGFLQYIETDELGIEFIRILEIIRENENITQKDIDKPERWNIGFPLKAAVRKKIVEKIGTFEIPKSYKTPKLVRSEHNIQGEKLGWHIIDRSTLKRKFKKKLNKRDLKLSPHGIMNDTMIVEYLDKGWKLEEWK